MTLAALYGRTSAALLDFRDSIGRSAFPRTAADIRLVDEQLTLARGASWATVLVVPLGAVLLAALMYGQLPLWRLIAWPVMVIVICGGAEMHYRHLLKIADHSDADVKTRARAHARTAMLQAAIWCSMAYFLLVPGNIENEALLILVLACSLSGWSSMGAFHLASGAAGMPFYGFALLYVPIASGMPHGYLLAAMCVAFWLLMRTLLMANYTTRERMIKLEQERGGLIEGLRNAKGESDDARLRAETASRAKSAFLANMSHELRTPLNAILGFSEIIQTKAVGLNALDKYAEYGGYIHGSGQHLLSLINDILDLAKIESGRLTLRETTIDLRRLLEEAVKMMETRATAGGISLAIQVDRAFPNIHADERALRQMMVNLASNAVKFTPNGGRVTAFAKVLADGSLAFGIDDTGIGIPEEEHHKVFESFGQGRHDAILADKGTGLGLPIVKGLAEAHGGRVELTSVPNEGTRVTVVFPADRARERLRAAG